MRVSSSARRFAFGVVGRSRSVSLDHALGEEDVGRRAIDLGDPAGRREHEIERVDQRLRARVRSTLQVGGDLAHDPAVVGELH